MVGKNFSKTVKNIALASTYQGVGNLCSVKRYLFGRKRALHTDSSMC